MGMYDTDYIECPQCKNQTSIQSKGGRCELKNYTLETASKDIIEGLNDKAESCGSCGIWLQVVDGKIYKYTLDTIINNGGWCDSVGYILCQAIKEKEKYKTFLKTRDYNIEMSYDELEEKYEDLLDAFGDLVNSLDIFIKSA